MYLVMLEDLMIMSYLRKSKLSQTSAYFKRCQSFVQSGYVASCSHSCRVCDGSRRYSELLKFFALRNQDDRPERKFNFINTK